MKKILFITTAFLLFAFLNSCKKTDYPPFYKESCKVLSTAVVEDDGGYKAIYTYDTKGNISGETTNMFGIDIEYKYKRKSNGEIESAYVLYAGQYNGTTRFTYSNGRVVKLEDFYEDPSYGDFPMGIVSNLKYNPKGLITEITQEFEYNPENSLKKVYEYDAMGQITRKTTSDLNGKVIRQEIHKNVGASSPSSAIYLTEHGLPFQIYFLYPYEYSDPGIGSAVGIYSPDSNGKLVLAYNFIIKSKELNARGYTESITRVLEKEDYTSTFTAQYDCSTHGKGK